jgi:hypothetical protein
MENDRFLDRFGRTTEILKLVSRQRTIHPRLTIGFIPPRHRNRKNKGGGHGDRWDRRLLALWDDVH